MRIVNLVGQRFVKLIVLEKVESITDSYGRKYGRWRCRCDCGNETIVRTAYLTIGDTKSCGCLLGEKNRERLSVNLIGQRYGKLIVIKQLKPRRKYNNWLCLCDCGGEVQVLTCDLNKGIVHSCGCERKNGFNLRHGHDRKGKMTRTYKSWSQMKDRCANPNCHAYRLYGGAGIQIDERWLDSFENFLEDMGERPEGKSLDRYPDPYGNYEPNNCRWATRKEQANNVRKNIFKEVHHRHIY